MPPFATLAAKFCVAQLGLSAAPSGTIIYPSEAPWEDEAAARVDNAGAVCEAIDCSTTEAGTALETLARAGLIERQESAGGSVTYFAR